jgi:ABC-type polysaccharide/polyol phosphate export permease
MLTGNTAYIIRNLVLKDFRLRYRSLSIGVLWSLLSPLVLMGVLAYVFTNVFPTSQSEHFTAYILCGLVPFTAFSTTVISGTGSVVENSFLLRRARFSPYAIPLASILANAIHFAFQVVVLLLLALATGISPAGTWLLLPFVSVLYLVFLAGAVLLFSSLNVYYRDVRYIVESFSAILFWFVPIFYPETAIPSDMRPLFEYNPVAATVFLFREIVLNADVPAAGLWFKLAATAGLFLSLGFATFQSLQSRFYEKV